ncbi:MAG TPA: DUF4058 family protein [Gemmataceae bacterium]|nr:DUF4058 family protein [Gemmataceae bacterium]
MPLLDHFHPPVSRRKGWTSIHNGWAFVLAQRLNGGVLPEGFESEPLMRIGTQIEIDVATLEEDSGHTLFGSNGGVATAPRTYVPPAPTITAEVAIADADLVEVQVHKTTEGEWKLVAAIELVSPANKNRPRHRRAFARKVGAYLQKGVSVVVVDIVTERRANLHAELVRALRLPTDFTWASPSGLSVVAYRTVQVNETERMDVWPYALALGESLPAVPLWLAADLAVPLELEPTYATACKSLRLQ